MSTSGVSEVGQVVGGARRKGEFDLNQSSDCDSSSSISATASVSVSMVGNVPCRLISNSSLDMSRSSSHCVKEKETSSDQAGWL